MNTLGQSVLLVACLVWLCGCGEAPRVVQGAVVSYEPSSQTLVMQDETRPGVTLRLSLDGAEVGAEAAPGDTVRVAYHESGTGPVATRVMNVTRQDELGKKGAKGSQAAH